MRATRSRLKEKHAEEYEHIRLEVERDLYASVMETWNATATAASK